MLADASRSDLGVQYAPLQVILPACLNSFFAERGYLMSTPNEERSHARLNVRCEGYIRIHVADAMTVLHSVTHGTVLVKDLSKSGVALLYHKQIFPGESFDVLFHGRIISATAVRCRRIDVRCYEIGAAIDCIERAVEESE